VPPTPTGDSDRSRFNRQIDEAFTEASKLAGSALAPTDFYEQFLTRALGGINAPAGAVWLRTPQGFLQVACQVNLEKVGLDDKRGGRQCHNEVLRQVFQVSPARPILLEPQARLTGASAEPGAAPAANLTDYYALFAPIVGPEKQSLGLLEVFQDSNHEPKLYQTYLQYTLQMAGYASQYHSFTGNRQNAGTEKVFAQVEAFARLIHGTLNPTECAYHVANEGRRLIECDRLCVGVRHGSGVTVEAVSGADVVEKASTHVRRMRRLFDAVLKFNDKLVFTGTRDDALPPDVLKALDEYLAESQPKLLVVQPIRDEREKEDSRPARSVLLVECFNPPEETGPMIQRLEVVGKHAAPALYNAAELKRIPFKFLWWPVIKVQDGLGGKTRFYMALGATVAVLLALAMVFVPYPHKMDAKGQFMPEQVKNVYAPHEGEIIEILVGTGQIVEPGKTPLVKFHSAELNQQIAKLEMEKAAAQTTITLLNEELKKTDQGNKFAGLEKLSSAEATVISTSSSLADLLLRNNMIVTERGNFLAKAPRTDLIRGVDPGRWKVLNDDNRPTLTRKTVRSNEPLLKLGAVFGPWRGEIKIPQGNIGHIMRAFKTDGLHQVEEVPNPQNPLTTVVRKYLPVDVLFAGSPDTNYAGKLYESDVSQEAVPNKDDHNESAPVILAYVRIDLENLSEQERAVLFVAGQELHVKIRCGNRALGYSLFHGVWEWFYEKVVFFF
jgi:hypothetical protein